ncbi:hypothetical protein ACFY9A_38935 [Streptomyces rubradiris]|uniref:hypothetical protein n=1 Tax=Streptomyces rubradiris TaxID=285531 RepID=UPI0036F07AD5
MVLTVDVVVTAAVALTAGYLLGRLRPWQRLGNWAADQVRFTETWARGGTVRQAVVVLAQAVTAPRSSWRIMRAPATDAPVPVPVHDPGWVAHRTHHDKGGTP